MGPILPPHAPEMAAVLASGPGAVVSHASAALLWRMLPSWVEEQRRTGRDRRNGARWVDVVMAGSHRGRRPGIRLHRVESLPPGDRTELEGIPVTVPARTVVDLATVLGTRELEAAIAAAEREGMVTREDLERRLAGRRGRPGAPALRSVLEARGGPALTRSEAEARVLALIRKAGLPVPETNVRIGPYEVDLLWREARLVVEVDGYHFHAPRPRFEADRRRDAWLLGAGIQVVRLSWRQITEREMVTVVQLAQALARKTP